MAEIIRSAIRNLDKIDVKGGAYEPTITKVHDLIDALGTAQMLKSGSHI